MTTTTTTTTTTTSNDKCTWEQGSTNAKCNQAAGEVALKKSSVMVSSLEQCKKSCEDAAGCRSITYFATGWCAHFSTPCTNTKKSGKAVVQRLARACKAAQTTSEFAQGFGGPPAAYFAYTHPGSHFLHTISRPGWACQS